MSLIALGALSAAGAIAGSALGWGSQNAANAANMEIARYQYRKNLEMWNRQNAYNHPSKQMERLSAAGLNPHLVYGSGSASGNTASAPPEFHAPTMQAYQGFGDLGVGAGISAYLQAQQTEASVANTNADTHNKELEGELKQYQVDTTILDTTSRLMSILKDQKIVEGLGLDNEEKKILLQFANAKQQAALANLLANTKNIESQTNYRDNVETPLGNAKTANVIADTEFTKGPKTYATYAAGNASNANAANTAWNTERSQALFAHDLQALVNSNVISEKQADILDNEIELLGYRIKNVDADTQVKLVDAAIKRWNLKYGLPIEAATKIADTLLKATSTVSNSAGVLLKAIK